MRGIKPLINRKYLVTVRNAQGEYEYVERSGNNSDLVYCNACAEFGGRENVGKVYVLDSAGKAYETLKIRGIKPKS